MNEYLIIKTRDGIFEMPRDRFEKKPPLLFPAFWTRIIELCTDWTRGKPRKAKTDILIPDALFRKCRDKVERFLYENNPDLIGVQSGGSGGRADNQSLEMVSIINKIKNLNWKKLSENKVMGDSEKERLVEILKIDKQQTLVKLRMLLEQMVNYIIKANDMKGRNSLEQKIGLLKKEGLIHEPILTAIHSVRKAGNAGSHEKLDVEDLENFVLGTTQFFIQVVDWFLKEIA
ncbi:MAG: DUF4145 domain-containing protein [Promethearchaeota archaeon]